MTELMEDQNHALYRRQLGFFNPEEHNTATVSMIGLGGIGSFAALGIAKLGIPTINIMDDDSVELHNVPNQFHSMTDANLGITKVQSMADTMVVYADNEPNCYTGRITDNGFTGNTEWKPRGIVISGVDTMSSRMDIWNHGSIKFNPRVTHYIDARIAGQLIVVYCVNPNDLNDTTRYEATLHPDSEGVVAPCTERGVIDVGLTVGALLTNMVRHALTGGTINPVTTINLAAPPVTSGDWVLPAT